MSSQTGYSQAEIAEARRYPIIVQWSEIDHIYLASAPDLENLVVHGDTPEEAISKIPEAVANWLYGMRSVGQPIPEPSAILSFR